MASFLDPPIFQEAVEAFWQTRQLQQGRQRQSGQHDQGARGAVTGGQQMAGFSDRIVRHLTDGGINPDFIYARRKMTGLPGYFRPLKQWDIVVIDGQKLLAAIELKSQVGPSFGNNFNNRTEEALGSAVDLWTAYREGVFGPQPAPWLGFFMVLEDCPATNIPITVTSANLPIMPEFVEASYAQRYKLFCRRLVLERHYTSACLLLTRREDQGKPVNYTEPADDLGGPQFLSSLLRQVAP